MLVGIIPEPKLGHDAYKASCPAKQDAMQLSEGGSGSGSGSGSSYGDASLRIEAC